jgi:hypothetical protein
MAQFLASNVQVRSEVELFLQKGIYVQNFNTMGLA